MKDLYKIMFPMTTLAPPEVDPNCRVISSRCGLDKSANQHSGDTAMVEGADSAGLEGMGQWSGSIE